MIADDNNNTCIKILESSKTHEPKANTNEKTIPDTKMIPKKKTESISKKKEVIKIDTAASQPKGAMGPAKTIIENVLPLTEKQRAEFELFEKLIND